MWTFFAAAMELTSRGTFTENATTMPEKDIERCDVDVGSA